MKQYSAGLWHATKIGFYTTTSDDKLNFQTENKLQSTSWSQTPFIKLVMVTIWWSAVGLIHYSFLSPGKTITPEKYTQQINELHWKLQCCSKCWSTERAQLFSGTTPDYISHNQPFKSWTNWATNFCLICEIHLTTHQMTTTASSILTTFFAEKMLPQPAGGRKCFPEFIKSQSMGFYATGINNLIFIGKNVLTVMFPILINKNVFEPHYNDLKLRVWNHNNFWTKLCLLRNLYAGQEATVELDMEKQTGSK